MQLLHWSGGLEGPKRGLSYMESTPAACAGLYKLLSRIRENRSIFPPVDWWK